MAQAFYDPDLQDDLLPDPSLAASNAPYLAQHHAALQQDGGYQAYLSEHGLVGQDGYAQAQGEGDDGMDAEMLERERRELAEQQAQALEAVPEDVKRFIGMFHQAILSNDLGQITNMYEGGWNRLTAQHYSNNEWPEAEIIAPLVGHDQVFLTLYRELYFRHVYAKLEPNVDDRFQSYENICELFNLLLNSEQPVPLDLPIQWLWDMLDEFVYQFQSFAAWREKVQSKSEDELGMLADNSQVWSCYSVLNVLYSLVQKSRINEQLVAEKEGKSAEEVAEIAGDFGSKPLYRNLGYFSLICLLRVHVLLGDPTLALQTMANVELTSKGLLQRITACHVATYYHVGFAYMALGRYPDAIKTFISVLIYFNRMKQYHTRSYQYGSIAKQCERMYALLAICTTLSPGPTDEGIMSIVKEHYADQLAAMQRPGDDAIKTFKELFLSASPKFLSPISPPYEDHEQLALWVADPPRDAADRHVELFLADVATQLSAPTMRSFLKLYTSIDAGKLASFLDEDQESVLEKMMNLKNASRTFGHKQGEGSLLDGERLVTNNLDFSIDGTMVHVAETTTNRRHAGFFIRNAEHAQRVFDTIRSSPLPISRAAATAASAQSQQAKGAAPGAAAARPGGYAARAGAPAAAGAPNGTAAGKPAVVAGRPGASNAWGSK